MSCDFPQSWKQAEVIPLIKEGDHEIPSNNRPLSLLIVALKICEKIVLPQFTSFLSSRNHLTSHQNGNRKFHSPETLNILVSDYILEAMDQRSATACALIRLIKSI